MTDVLEVTPDQAPKRRGRPRKVESKVEENGQATVIKTVEDRLLAKRGATRDKELTIRKAERDHWVGVLSRLGDGRANRGTPAEERAVYRRVAAMLSQDRHV